MRKFKKGDIVKFLGTDSYKGTSPVSMQEWASELTIGEDYIIDCVLDHTIPTDLEIRVKSWFLPRTFFKLVKPVEEVISEEYNEHDAQPFKTELASMKDLISKDNLVKLADKDYTFFMQVEKLVNYLASTYDDKYEASEPNAFHPRELLTKEVCMFNASKYLKRYSTEGFEKSDNPNDVLKAIHYLLMNLAYNGRD
jgi:hypothetical protein